MSFVREVKRQSFTDFDKSVFIKIVKKYLEVLECKKTDSTTSQIKEATWRKIHQIFILNCPNAKYCHPKHLQVLWKNLKSRAKQDVASFSLAQSNGVPSPPVREISQRVSEMLLSHSLALTNNLKSEAKRIRTEAEYVASSDSDEEPLPHILLPKEEILENSACVVQINEAENEVNFSAVHEEKNANYKPVKNGVKAQKRKHGDDLMLLKEKVYAEELRMRKQEHEWRRELYELKKEKLKLKIKILKKRC